MTVLARAARLFDRNFGAALAISLTSALSVCFGSAGEVLASTNRQIVVDPATGMALYGYDPVAYFIDGKAHLGKSEYERSSFGMAWRFVNQGNMKAFFDAPQVYCPRYGGYGALSVAKGLTTEGKPVIFEIYKGKLYFFYSPANKHIWLDNPDAYIAAADWQWDIIRNTLSR